LKVIFNEAQKFVQVQEPNFSYLVGDESTQIVAALADPECFKGNRMQQVKTLLDVLQKKVAMQIEAEIATAKGTMTGLQGRLCAGPEFTGLSEEQRGQITKSFADCSGQVEKQTLIAVIRDTLRRFEETEYPQLLSRISAWSQVKVKPAAPAPGDFKPSSTPETVTSTTEPPIHYVTSRSVRVSFDKPWLADESDVERYLDSMREALLTEIRSGRRIQV
jgi:hypothetical protein